MARGKGVALVTGAAGFTGWHMVKLLLEEGYEIIATDCRKSNNDPVYKLTRFIEIDLTNPADVFDEGFLKELAEAQFVFHIAGIFDHAASLSKLFEVNVLGTRNLLDAIRRAHAGEAQKYPRVIIWGASGIFGDFSHISLPATEAMPPRTDNPYFLSKLYEELEALRFWQRDRLPVTVLRPSAVYGSHSVYGMALSITTLLKSRMAFVVGNGKNKGVLVHVRDVVPDHVHLHDPESGNRWNFAGGRDRGVRRDDLVHAEGAGRAGTPGRAAAARCGCPGSEGAPQRHAAGPAQEP